ncbi:cyanuric acid amidohydrolase, partial [filamentous cyanobacterium CCP5]
MHVELYKIPQGGPDDVSGLDRLIQDGKLNPADIVALLGKTEGNGCVNDFTRGYAVQTLKHYLSGHIGADAASQLVYVMSGGTEGVLSPHLNVFTRSQRPDLPQRWGLVMGVAHTRDFTADEVGTVAMVKIVAEAVMGAIAQAGLEPDNVHFVQIKCPLVPAAQSAEQRSSYQSMALSRGASALGIALALGEITPEQVPAAAICHNYSLYSGRASTSAGVELKNCEIFVLGNAAHATGSLLVGHDVMAHALDADAVTRALNSTGQPNGEIINVFAKAEADPGGYVVGRRHTMLDDSDISHTR